MLSSFFSSFSRLHLQPSQGWENINSNHQGFDLKGFHADLLIEAFTSLSLKDLYSSSLVCKRWNQIIQSDQLWELICRSSPEILDDFLPLIKKGVCSWNDACHYAPLVSALNQTFQSKLSNSWSLNHNSIRHPYLFMPQPFLRHGNYRFGIVENSKVIILNAQNKELGVLCNEKDSMISRLQSEGDFLFTLNQKGLISQWNFKEQKLVKEIETEFMKKGPQSNILYRFPALSICHFFVHEGYILIKYGGIDPLIEVISYVKQSDTTLFSMQNISVCRFCPFSLEQGKLYIVKIPGSEQNIFQTEIIVIDLQKNNEEKIENINLKEISSLSKFAIGKNNFFVGLSKSFRGSSRIDVYDRTNGQRLKQIVLPNTLRFEKLVALGHLLFCFQFSRKARVTVIDTHTGEVIGSVGNLFNLATKDLNSSVLEELVMICKENTSSASIEGESMSMLDRVMDCFTKRLHL